MLRALANETTLMKKISYKDVSRHFNEISLSQEVIQEITEYLKEIYESEGKFYQEQKNRLRREQDQMQQRLSKLYDDRYDGNVDEVFFQKKLKSTKIGSLPLFRRWKVMPRQTKVSISRRIWS